MRLTTRLLASLGAIGAVAVLSGCVAVPADPYYGGYAYPTAAAYVGTAGYYDGYGYGYGAFGGPVVIAPPALSIGIGGVFGRGWYGHGYGWRGRPGWGGGHYGGYHGYRGGGGGWGHGGRR